MVLKLKDYAPIVGDKAVEEIQDAASQLSETNLLHVNSTYYGGGVAEILNTLVLLMNDAGVRTGWRLLKGDPDFFGVTKKFHDGLQGAKINLSPLKKKIYEEMSAVNSRIMHLDGYDADDSRPATPAAHQLLFPQAALDVEAHAHCDGAQRVPKEAAVDMEVPRGFVRALPAALGLPEEIHLQI